MLEGDAARGRRRAGRPARRATAASSALAERLHGVRARGLLGSSTAARCGSSTRCTSRCPTTRSWSPTCASPATGWPASTRRPRRAGSRSRSAGARSATPSRPRWAPRWPDRGPAVAVVGDGGFLFACGELATIAQERIPLTTVIVDDGGYGMLRYDQDVHGDERYGVDLHTPDFAALATRLRDPRRDRRRARGRVRRGARAARARAGAVRAGGAHARAARAAAQHLAELVPAALTE